jgi:hypothetical protein
MNRGNGRQKDRLRPMRASILKIAHGMSTADWLIDGQEASWGKYANK